MRLKILRCLKRYGVIALLLFSLLMGCIYSTNVNLFYAILSVILLLMVLALIDMLIGKSVWYKCLSNPVVYPNNNWYRKHHERDFDYILLGCNRLSSDCCVRGGKCFDFRLEGQTLYWDFNILKNTFSILKENGIVIFQINEQNKDSFNVYPKHLSRYYNGMSTYLLARNAIQHYIVKLSQQSSILFLLIYLCEFFKPILKSDVVDLNGLKKDITEFCEERNLRVVFVNMS